MADFFGNLKSKLDQGLNTVGAKSKEVIEVTKINNQIAGLKDQIGKIERELGEAVYEMHMQQVFDQKAIQERCEAITRLKQQITAKEDELKGVHMTAAEAMGRTFCPKCKTEVPAGAKFCNSCGNKIGEG